MTEIRIIEQGVTLKIASYSPIGVVNEGDLDPANQSSGSATAGQVPVADGAGGIDWSDESGLGDVTGPAGGVVDSGVAVYSGTTGKVIKKPVAAVDFNAQAITNVGAVAGHVQTSRQIIDGTGISGGGDLSADRTLSVNQSALDPANMTSGSATDGYVATADGLGGVAWEGVGNVTGPGSSTDHALARWDSTGGDTLLNSGVTLSDAGAMVFPSGGSISKPGSGAGSEAFGLGAVASAANAVAVGNASVLGASGVGIGQSASIGSDSSDCVAIGLSAAISSSADDAVAIGKLASVSASNGVAIGDTASSTGSNGIAIGFSSQALATFALALGSSASNKTGASNSIAIGTSATNWTNINNAICIGRFSECANSGDFAIAIGDDSAGKHLNGVAIGRGAETTANTRCTIGSIGGSYDMELQCGKGFACFGATPPGSQPTKISDPTDLPSCITAITAIIDILEGAGLSAAT